MAGRCRKNASSSYQTKSQLDKHANIVNSSNHSNNHSSRPKLKLQKAKEKTCIKFITRWSQYIPVVSLAIVAGLLHRYHLSTMFESQTHFSHLSTLERELSFRTELGLYYSYFKTIIEAPSFAQGMSMIMYDNVTEHGRTINTLKRFNLYPEVIVGLAYRLFESAAGELGIETKQCWQVNRGEGYTPVQSCTGIGSPEYFYTEAVFWLNGVNMAMFFFFGSYLSGSLTGGVISCASFFYNHGEATRVQWTPPLRESWAYPFHILQMLVVTYILRVRQLSLRHSALLCLSVVAFMLPWQFAQFCLTTQLAAIYASYLLGFIGQKNMKYLLLGLSGGLLMSYVLLFGNEMLFSSFFASSLIVISILVFAECLLKKISHQILFVIFSTFLWSIFTVYLKFKISKFLNISDDAHIGDILRAKFTNFKNFHTQLYICAPEFDFMDPLTPGKVFKTLLAPIGGFTFFIILFKMVTNVLTSWASQSKHNSSRSLKSTCRKGEVVEEDVNLEEDADVFYHILQQAAFFILALLIMRLKLFWTPHLCLISSLLASRKYFSWIGKPVRHQCIIYALLGLASIQGIANIAEQRAITGEYSNYPMEELVEWIQKNTSPDAVFAGPMPTMATIKLVTKRPIANHPHYEDSELRERTKKVYSLFSRQTPEEVYDKLMELDIDYAILEQLWCNSRSRPGCGIAELFDIDEPKLAKKVPVCHSLHSNPEPHFSVAFQNSNFQVLRLNKST